MLAIDRLDLVEIRPLAGREVVEAYDRLIQAQEFFDERGADEAGGAGDEPGFWGEAEGGLEFVVAGHSVRRVGGSGWGEWSGWSW